MKHIDKDTPVHELQEYLVSKDWIADESILQTSIPGEGNMNVVLKVETDKRSFILKQSRPYVQKYPQIPAPLGRIETEFQFYEALKGSSAEKYLPKILAFDPSDCLMMLDFIEGFEDMVRIYEDRSLPSEMLEELVNVLNIIHESNFRESYPLNIDLRQLNHQHIFVLPFREDNGFSLDDVQLGLHEIAHQYVGNTALQGTVDRLGKMYLSKGKNLLHGDYYPGSWMRAHDQLYVIDAEFSYVGSREFDIGVMAAHLLMATSNAQVIDEIIHLVSGKVSQPLIYQMTGIEVMRRIIGLAQLPLSRTVDEKDKLLKLAHELICS